MWGVVVTSTISVFSMSVTFIVLCWWNKGPRLFLKTRRAVFGAPNVNVENVGPRESHETSPLERQDSENTIYDEQAEREKRKRTGLTPPPESRPPASVQIEVHKEGLEMTPPSAGAEGGVGPCYDVSDEIQICQPF